MKIGLLGHVVVGSGVRKIIDEMNSDMEVAMILVKNESEVTEERITTNADMILNRPDIDLICECMGGLEPAHTFVKKAILNGKHVVTSNKKMLATFAEELFPLAKEHNVILAYEACVGGGIPWIHELNHVNRLEPVRAFNGIFNGTTNYILSRMQDEGKDFDEMLKEAQKAGYAEADPSDDIDGFDVRYKVALSAMCAFDAYVKPEDIPTYGIRNILKQDTDYAKEHGYVIKLIGSGSRNNDELTACVRPMLLKKNDLLSGVGLNFNGIQSVSDTLGPATYVGQGAGCLPTAHAVVQDILDVKAGINNHHELEKMDVVTDKEVHDFYIRTTTSLNEEKIGENTYLIHNMTYAALKTLVNDEKAFVAEVQK